MGRRKLQTERSWTMDMGPVRRTESDEALSVLVHGLRRKEREGAKEAATVDRIYSAGSSAQKVPEAKKQARALRSRERPGGGEGRKSGQAPRLPARERERIAFRFPPRGASFPAFRLGVREGPEWWLLIIARRARVGPTQHNSARDRAEQGSDQGALRSSPPPPPPPDLAPPPDWPRPEPSQRRPWRGMKQMAAMLISSTRVSKPMVVASASVDGS
ncbi:hypothetical protein HU200_066643 [Digitaria exilis]|uniref:Uncharacterized protein n=1 Tax=Digitaria exilis TaxID=1010633 RepID=A0A835A0R7_9POAL|nr:hypothetical protein HU200_066643 [Digitaria exilis]